MASVSTPQRAVAYLRLSVERTASVSIDRQRRAVEDYVRAQGLDLVAVVEDSGVSAKNAPASRAGWREVMARSDEWDVCVVWSLDRLVRRVAHYWDVHRWMEAEGKGVVFVKDGIDATAPIGMAILTFLAAVAQMEWENTSTRVAAARDFLLLEGRWPGGRVPYGFTLAPNVGGRGWVLAPDPATHDVLREMCARVSAGATVWSVKRWLDESGTPTPTWRGAPFALKEWAVSTVERSVRQPLCAGMVARNPGNTDSRVRGDDVVRDPLTGMPVVYDGLAVLPVAEWRTMLARLDGDDTGRRMPRSERARTSPLLSGLLWCADDRHPGPVRMHRGTTQGRPSYNCRLCSQTVSNFEGALVDEVLRVKGEDVRWRVIERVVTDGQEVLPEIQRRLDEVTALIRATGDRAGREALREQEDALLDLQAAKRAERPTVQYVSDRHPRCFAEDWAEATDDAERRAILDGMVERVLVRRGRPGRRTRDGLLARFDVSYRETHGAWHEPDESWLVESEL